MALKLVAVILVIGLIGFFWGKRRAWSFVGGAQALHSQPIYHGLYVAIWAVIPAVLSVLVWLGVHEGVLQELLWRSIGPDLAQGAETVNRSLVLSEISRVARGLGGATIEPFIQQAANRLVSWQTLDVRLMLASGVGLAFMGLFISIRNIQASFRTRQRVERFLSMVLMGSALFAIMVTVGIFVSLVFESYRFFSQVPLNEFLFGLNWEPQIPIREDQVAGIGAFGAVPVFAGTILIASVAMSVAVPIGLFSAIYLSQFASDGMRGRVKPVIELLAGVPTIVYGFFAVTILTPLMQDTLSAGGIYLSPTSALVAGCTMGVMLIPFISSLSDDALTAVPRAMRDGSLAMGATISETVKHVLLPAALPGIMGGVLLAMSRAIGETMIVVMAAGIIAKLTLNPLDNASTVTVQIVTLLIGDTEFDNPKTLAAFALGFILFLATLVLNIIALRVVQKYREKYE